MALMGMRGLGSVKGVRGGPSSPDLGEGCDGCAIICDRDNACEISPWLCEFYGSQSEAPHWYSSLTTVWSHFTHTESVREIFWSLIERWSYVLVATHGVFTR